MYNARNSLKIFGFFVLASHTVLASKPAEAISLQFEPNRPATEVGGQVTVDIVASDPRGSTIGSFDLFVGYDPTVLTLHTVVFGDALGGPLDSIQENIESPTGTVNLSEVSLLSDLTLLQNGADNVLLFSLVFDADTLGASFLSFNENIAGIADGFLVDENGQAIALEGVAAGSINVVPLPGAFWLMGSGLLALYGFKKRRSVAG